jgi:hypothetical protein
MGDMNMKKRLLFTTGLISLFLFILNISPSLVHCSVNTVCENILWQLYNLGEYLFAAFITFFLFFIFSCVTYFLKDSVFKAWLWLGVIYIPVSIIWSFNTPSGHGLFITDSPGYTSILIGISFFIFSIFVILSAHLWYKNKK